LLLGERAHTRMSAESVAAARDLVRFLNASPSPFHAVREATARLSAAGFTQLSERSAWERLEPGGKYFCTRNQTAVVGGEVGEERGGRGGVIALGRGGLGRGEFAQVAWVVGGAFRAGNGFTVTAAHTDSPCLRIKPVSSSVREGLELVGSEFYGGGIWHTWFDRDLSIAGRVLTEHDGHIDAHIVNVEKPILRIPSLAIHLDRTVNDSFKVNTETHLWAVLAQELKASLGPDSSSSSTSAAASGGGSSAPSSSSSSSSSAPSTTSTSSSSSSSCGCCERGGTVLARTRHSSVLVECLAEAAGVRAEDVVDFEVCMYDTQPSTLGGAREEFIFSARLDNLLSCYCGVESLIAAAGAAATSPNTVVLGLFDHEEVGSSSVPGAASTFLEDVLKRVTRSAHPATEGAGSVDLEEAWPIAMRKSLLISADMAHGAHPNYAEMHERNHRPRLNKGPVIKGNINQRYATTAVTASAVRMAAAAVDVPVQEFVIRQDLGCGSTVGPIIATRLGLRTVDIGVPQLSMHSVREMCGAHDVLHAVRLLTSLYNNWHRYDGELLRTD
jgi:aspartyl aminopeptidase